MSPADRLPPNIPPPESPEPRGPYLNPRVEPELEADAEPPFATMPEVTERELQADTLAFEQVGRHRPRSWGVLKLVLALAVVGGGAYAAWHKWGADLMAPSGDDIPTIHAADGPYKFRPETPGGADIPNRDKDVYGLMDKPGAPASKGKAENLQPRPEKPLPPPMPAAPPQSAQAEMSGEGSPQMTIEPGEDDDDTEMVEVQPDGTQAAPPSAAPAQAAKPVATPAVVPPKSPATTTAPLPSPDQVRNAPKPPAPPVKVDGQVASAPATAPTGNAPIRVTPSSPATGGGKGFKIQLGAVRSEEAARIEWDKLRKTYAPVLGRLTLNIDKADLGVKGIYYRIQAGPFSDRAAADAACQELTKQKTPCLAIRPEG